MGRASGEVAPAPGTRVRYPGLDVIRLVAFVMVLSLHLGAEGTIRSPDWLTLFHPSGEHGVNLFFVLSGYLVYGNLLRQFQSGATSDATTTLSFWLRRASRTFVPYWVMVVFYKAGAPLLGGHGIPSERSALPYFAYLQNYAYDKPYPFIHAWSLCAEEVFYFLAPIITFLLLRKIQSRFMKGALIASLVLFSPLCTIFRWYALDEAYRREVLYFTPHYRMFGLLVGCLLATARVSDHPVARRVWSFLQMQRKGLFALGAGGMVLILCSAKGYAYKSLSLMLLQEAGFCLAAALVFPMAESWKVELQQSRWYLKALQFAAMRVYAAYLIHLTLIWSAIELFQCRPIPDMQGCHSWIPREFGYFSLVVFGGTLLGTMLLYGLVEHPVVSLGDRAIRALKQRDQRAVAPSLAAAE